MTPRRTMTAILVAAACAALTACSSSGSDSKSDPPSSPASVAAPASTAANLSSSSSEAPSQNQNLSAIVVQRSEVPSSYMAEQADTNTSDDADDDAVHQCVGLKPTTPDRLDEVKSTDFGTETASISSSAASFGSQASVDSDVTLFSRPKIKSCFETMLKKSFAKETNGTQLLSSKIDITPGANGGPKNLAGTVQAQFVVAGNGGKSITVSTSAYYISGPKLEVELSFTGIGTTFDPALEQKVLTAVAKRAVDA